MLQGGLHLLGNEKGGNPGYMSYLGLGQWHILQSLSMIE